MIDEGIELMVIGMGVVLLFLLLLVAFMNLSGALFTRFSHRFPDPKPPTPPAPSAQRKPDDFSAKLAVAVAAASRKRRQS